jgi:DNA-binding winged helix-turn-helix (wHTH) protein/Tol biopolymer transport system component
MTPGPLRFGPFEMDLTSGELWKGGVRVKLQQQPFRVLALLARNPGRLLTREEIQREVWPEGTFVDFEQALNFCIRQIRTVLGDNATTPHYVETLPRRGYRWIAAVEPARPLAAPPLSIPRPLPHGHPATRRAILIGLAVAATGLAGGAALARRHDPPPPVPSFQRLTFRRGYVGSARFSPDGPILYTAAWDGAPASFFSARAEGLDARPLDLPVRRVLAVARTGEVAFLTGDGTTLARAPVAGGPSKEVLQDVVAADWSRDGTTFAVARQAGGGVRIEYPPGRVVYETIHVSHLRISPDGERLAFLEHPVRADDRATVTVLDRQGRRSVLTSEWASAEGLAWSPAGDEVWFTAAQVGIDCALHAVTLDGRLRTVLPALGRFVLHDIAPDGRVLLERGSLRLEMRYRGPGDAEERDLSWFDLSRATQLTADGRSLLFVETGEGGGPGYGIYLRPTDGAVPLRVGEGMPTAVSPDGRWVLAIPLSPPDRLQLLPVGAGETRTVRDAGMTRYEWAGWLPDGRVLYTAREGARGPRVYVRDVGSGRPRAVTPEGVGVYRDTVSPDGRVVVASCGEGECLYPLGGDGGDVQPLHHPTGLTTLGWAGPGALFLREDVRVPARLHRLDLQSGRTTPFRELGPADRAGVFSVTTVTVTADGRAYAYSVSRESSDLYVATGLR